MSPVLGVFCDRVGIVATLVLTKAGVRLDADEGVRGDLVPDANFSM